MFDYYYGAEAEQFVFYRIPKVLFEVEGVKEISTDAKLLYGLMLDRMQLSAKNGWLDEEGRVYIYYTLEQVMENMNCARQKAAKLLDELEKDAGLIERVRTGLNKPNKIYVKNLSTYLRKSYFLKYENQTSGSMNIKLQEVRKSNSNNTDINNTNTSETDISQSIGEDAGSDVDIYHKPIKLTMEKPDGLMDTPFSKWGEIFGSATLANAVLDRLLHHSSVISIKGPSYRLKDKRAFLEAQEAEA